VSTLRIGLAGAGWVSRHHLDAYARLGDRATIVAIADPDRDAAAARAEAYGIPAVHDSVETMLDATELDAIDIAAPREAHAPICRLAADRGIDILCQKPLAPTLGEAEALVADLDGRVRLMVHENWRFRPHYRKIHAWIREGRIGEVRTGLMTILTSGLVPDAAGALPALVRQPMMAGLDRMLLMEVMIHHVDTLRFLVGPLSLRGASLGKGCPAIRGEDRATLFLVGDDGAAVSLVGDFMAHGFPPEQVDRLSLFGTEGAIFLEGDLLRLTGTTHERRTLDLAANYEASYLGAITHFLDRLEDGEPFETRPGDNLQTLAIVEAAYRMGLAEATEP
jgi:predicted dehydrogenase